jgi:hypothetical protein
VPAAPFYTNFLACLCAFLSWDISFI